MDLNIHLENTAAEQLTHWTHLTGKTVDTILQEAFKEWIDHHHQVKQWPKSILEFKGIPNIESFEFYREELLPPSVEGLKLENWRLCN